MSEIDRITFDGVTVSLVNDQGTVVATSLAVSGRPGSQAPSLQDQRSVGPLPEGSYFIDPSEIDWRDSIVERLTWSDGLGQGRVTMHPGPETELYGRGGFFLHGSQNGNGYGSAGCIDLNTNDSRILGLIQQNGASRIEVIVDYSLTRDRLENGPHPAFEECFPASTPIAISLTETRPISDIRVGDTVLAFDPSADLGRGALIPRKVVLLYRNSTDEWVKLTWAEGGEQKELIATPGHRFLDRFGNFPTIEEMLENGRATVVLASGELIAESCNPTEWRAVA